jgi:hypothetical protein
MKKFLTVNEILNMSADELKNVHSYTKKDGHFRCNAVGIYNINVTNLESGNYIVEWSEEHGDPQILLRPNEKIKGIHGKHDCNYDYSLYLQAS